jgi:outer membrane cobalamin receptor
MSRRHFAWRDPARKTPEEATVRLSRSFILPALVLALLFGTVATASAQQNPQPTPVSSSQTFTGIVVDQDGRPLPRVYVTVVNQDVGGFTGEDGRFAFDGTAPAGCDLRVALTGFVAQTRPCPRPASDPLRIVLTSAAIGEYVVVSATRTEAPLGQVGASATVFTADDLERKQMPLVADLLRQTTGATVIRNGGPGAVTSLFVRGGESDYNKVMLDGVPLNEPGGTFYFNNLTTENLDRVEVVRGAFSSLFGSDAMSSVVQLFTRRPEPNARQQPRGSVQFDGGSYDTMHFNAGVSGASERIDYSGGVARFTSDNRVPNSRLENTTLSGTVGFALGRTATLRAVGRGELEHTGTPGQTAFGRPDEDAFFERHDGVGGVTFDQQLTRDVLQRASYSLAASNQTSTNLVLDPPYTGAFAGHTAQYESSDFLFDNLTELQRHRASYQMDWRVARSRSAGDHLVTALADWDGERATLTDRQNATATKASRNNTGVSVQDQIVWPRLFITGGLRIESNDSFGTETVPRATAVFVAHPSSGRFGETRVKAGFGTGVKEPTISESYSLSFFARGNPDLKPERSRSAEVGVDQRFADDRAKVEVTYFDNRYEDLIWTETTDFTTFAGQYFNLVGLYRAKGVELGTEVAPAPAIRVRAGYTFLDSVIVESTAQTVVFEVGQWAFRRPRHSGFVGVGFVWSRVTADLTGVFTGRFVDSDFFLFDPPITEIPAHNTWDASVTVKIARQLSGVLVISNLTDRDYMEPVGYQPLQRVVRAGVRVGF